MTVDFKSKFFIFNPKSYLFGEHLLEMSRVADQLALDYPDIAVVLTCPYADLYRIASQTPHWKGVPKRCKGGKDALLPKLVMWHKASS